MEKVSQERIIENENLFRAGVNLPAAIFFAFLSINSIANSGVFILQIIFILLTIYFSLSVMSYAAYYTNERFEGKTEPQLKNRNLSKAIKFFPLAIVSTYIAANSITTSQHVVFQVLFISMALILILSTIAYAAFYTNDYYEQAGEH